MEPSPPPIPLTVNVFFPVTFFRLSMTLFEKVLVILKQYQSLQNNNICRKDQLTLIGAHEYYDAHRYDYDSSYMNHKVQGRYTTVFLMTVSKANHMKEDGL